MIYDKFLERTPKYDKRFAESLFDRLTQKGGGTQEKMRAQGKHFENNYELYIYAFFLGYYNESRLAFGAAKKTDFSHPIGKWGFKGNSLERKNHTWVQQALFYVAVNECGVDPLDYDKGLIDTTEYIKALINVIEEYTNGGLFFLEGRIEEGLNLIRSDIFLDLMVSSTAK